MQYIVGYLVGGLLTVVILSTPPECDPVKAPLNNYVIPCGDDGMVIKFYPEFGFCI